MTTILEQAQAAVAAAEHDLQQMESRNHQLRQQRGLVVDQGGGTSQLDAEIAHLGDQIRLGRAALQAAQRRQEAAESAIEQARGKVGNLQAAAAQQERFAAQFREQAQGWEARRDTTLAELAQARAAVAELLGVGLDELDQHLATSAPAPVVEQPLLVRPVMKPTPRLVVEFGVRKWYDDATGEEVTVDGSPLLRS